MSKPTDNAEQDAAEGLRSTYEARVAAELAAADRLAPGSDAVASRGARLAGVAVVKGLPGPAEASGGAALSGADGEAAVKALEALGWAADEMFFVLSRPEPGLGEEPRTERLRMIVEAVDPEVVVCLDAEAAADTAGAFEIVAPRFGKVTSVLGRRVVAVDGLEASLSHPAHKKRVWRQFQGAKPEGPVF